MAAQVAVAGMAEEPQVKVEGMSRCVCVCVCVCVWVGGWVGGGGVPRRQSSGDLPRRLV